MNKNISIQDVIIADEVIISKYNTSLASNKKRMFVVMKVDLEKKCIYGFPITSKSTLSFNKKVPIGNLSGNLETSYVESKKIMIKFSDIIKICNEIKIDYKYIKELFEYFH